jgi:hypothetical protein
VGARAHAATLAASAASANLTRDAFEQEREEGFCWEHLVYGCRKPAEIAERMGIPVEFVLGHLSSKAQRLGTTLEVVLANPNGKPRPKLSRVADAEGAA